MAHVIFLLTTLLAFANAFEADPSQVDNYLFAPINQTNDIGSRSGAVIGSSSDFGTIYVLGGEDSSGAVSSNYKFSLAKMEWTSLQVSFSRTGACYSQDSNRNGIWIFGGVGKGNNSEPFLQYTFDTTFTALTNPLGSIPLNGASCAALSDGSKFYALFGQEPADDMFDSEEMAENCSSSVAVYAAGPKTWAAVATTGAAPAGRVGSSAILYGNSLVVFGGMCGTEYFPGDVYRLDLTSNVWTKDNATNAPSGRAYASAFINLDTLFVYGGQTTAGAEKDAYTYDLVNKVWAPLNTTSIHPDARYATSTVGLVNRAFVFGGKNLNMYFDEAYQLVAENVCLTRGCEDCTGTSGCGWCSTSAKCIAGDTAAYVVSTCNVSSPFITDLDSCPQVFPSYGIALLVIGGVVVVGIIIFAIMKVRGGDDRDGYEKIS
jgi:N-acetylneuraminic acid mutarotase